MLLRRIKIDIFHTNPEKKKHKQKIKLAGYRTRMWCMRQIAYTSAPCCSNFFSSEFSRKILNQKYDIMLSKLSVLKMIREREWLLWKLASGFNLKM